MESEYWGLSLDDLTQGIWEMGSGDAVGAHYIAFEGDRETARQKLIAVFTALIDRSMYRANSYGSEWQEGDDED